MMYAEAEPNDCPLTGAACAGVLSPELTETVPSEFHAAEENTRQLFSLGVILPGWIVDTPDPTLAVLLRSSGLVVDPLNALALTDAKTPLPDTVKVCPLPTVGAYR